MSTSEMLAIEILTAMLEAAELIEDFDVSNDVELDTLEDFGY